MIDFLPMHLPLRKNNGKTVKREVSVTCSHYCFMILENTACSRITNDNSYYILYCSAGDFGAIGAKKRKLKQCKH